MGSASFPSLHLPTFFAKAHTQERLTRNRLVVRLYASVNFSVNESRDGSRRTASGLPTTRRAGRPLHTSAFSSTYSAAVVGIPSGLPVIRKQSQFGQLVNADRPTPRSLPDLHEQPDSSCGQCAFDGPGVPSDHSLAKTMKMVTRCSGLLAAIIGEPGRLPPQLFSASPATRNITCGCQLLAPSFRYCCFDIM